MSEAARAQLAAEQGRLAAALLHGATAPEGFDGGRVSLAAEALARKRARSVAKSWPRTAESLGARYAARFAEYAAERPGPGGGPLADGWLFVRWLGGREALADGAVKERVGVAMRFRWCDATESLVARRGPGAAWGRLDGGGLVVAVRVWRGREWWWRAERRGDDASVSLPR